MKRGFRWIAISLIISLLLVAIVLADEPPGSGSGREQPENQQLQDQIQQQTGANVNLGETSGASLDGNVLTVGQTQIDLSGFSGSNIIIKGEQITIDGQDLSGAKKISKKDNVIYIDDVAVVIGDGAQKIQADRVETFQVGPIVITNGVNVRYADGCVSADYADSLIEVDNVVTTASQISYCKKKIEVKKADSVWAGCVLMENVKNSKITAGTRVDIEPDEGVSFNLKDCAQNEVVLEAIGPGALLQLGKSTISPEYSLKNVQINLTKDGITEFVNTKVLAKAVIHRTDGIQSVTMGNGTTYGYLPKDPLQAVAITSLESQHNLYIRKALTSQLPSQVKDCKSCTVLDFANHFIELRGAASIGKSQVRIADGKSLGLKEFFTASSQKSRAILNFDDRNEIAKEIAIIEDAPPYKTVISNYLTVYEELVNGKTERLLEINEKIPKEELAYSLVKEYKTAYSIESRMSINNNVLEYRRALTIVDVLPDGHSKIQQILQQVKNAQAVLLLALVPGLGFALWRKKAQISMFIIAGLIILFIVGLAVFVIPSITSGDSLRVSSQQDVTDFVTSCLEVSAAQAIGSFGIQGSNLPASPAFVHDGINTSFAYDNGQNNLNKNPEETIASDALPRFNRCIDNFRPLKSAEVEIKSSPSISIILGERDTSVTASYNFAVHRQDAVWNFDTFTTTLNAPVKNYLDTAVSTINSQSSLQNRISLDALENTNLVLFPLSQTLMAFVEDPAANNGFDNFVFFYANRR